MTEILTRAKAEAMLANLEEMAMRATTEQEARQITSQIAQVTRRYRIEHGIGIPTGPAEQAAELNQDFVLRPHLEYLSTQIAEAVRRAERGENQHIAVSMPPRSGKSTMLSLYTPVWMLRRHPEWKMILASHDGSLTHSWTKASRRLIERNPSLGVAIERDGGATRDWRTVEGGGMLAATTRSGITGRGARVLIIDDPVRDFVEAHSLTIRQNLWDWWLSTAQTRLEPPYIVMVVMTRWHEDDFVGRLLSHDHEGDPALWNRISLPAIAEEGDVLGREPGEPLYSPLLDESRSQALDRWDDVKRGVGTYTFSAMYQQRPAPARGAIFDAGWWRYWTTDPDKATEDGRIVYIDPNEMSGGQWVDSWDCSFKSSSQAKGGWVVGQRWVKSGPNRYLIAQQRGRWSFTQTIEKMQDWAVSDNQVVSPWGQHVHERLVEERANGAAIIDVLKEHISGIKPINPTVSKEARARAVTPEIESGNVFIPHPTDPGNEWVQDFLSELRNFPHDAADDQVDALTQALSHLRTSGRGQISVPGGRTPSGLPQFQRPRNVARAALSDMSGRRRFSR